MAIGWMEAVMTDLENFARELELHIGLPSNARPFVCEGSPLTCIAFIVGFNAATELRFDFWKHWRDGYGFDKATWFAEYLAERAARPLKPGRTRRLPVSTTRKRLNIVVDAAAPVRCLETNIHSVASASAAELAVSDRGTAVFDFLLARVRPRVILAHGDEAVAHLRTRKTGAVLIESAHFASRGGGARGAFTDAEGERLGRSIRQTVEAR